MASVGPDYLYFSENYKAFLLASLHKHKHLHLENNVNVAKNKLDQGMCSMWCNFKHSLGLLLRNPDSQHVMTFSCFLCFSLGQFKLVKLFISFVAYIFHMPFLKGLRGSENEWISFLCDPFVIPVWSSIRVYRVWCFLPNNFFL